MSSSTRDSWGRLQRVFAGAVQQEAGSVAGYLDRECAGDAELRRQVEELLDVQDEADSVLELRGKGDAHFRKLLDSMAPPMPGRIGRFRIVRELASGGMGVVYEAEQDEPQRRVALKVMRGSLVSESARRRFQFESQILARLRHGGIAQVYESGTHAGPGGDVPYYVMEFIADGRAITDYAEAESLDPDARIALFARVCDAVHHGHQKGVIHRDVKPSNILVDPEGNPKIIDFGVARAVNQETERTHQTQAGQMIGTLQYMSPEQTQGDSEAVDTRSDVYSLGVVLYELLSGRTPYDVSEGNVVQAARVIQETPPPRLSSIDARMRGDVETIVKKAMEKDAARRYHSAAELAGDLRRYLRGEAITARPPSLAYLGRVLVRRNKALTAAVACIAVLLVAATVVSTWFYVRAEHDRAIADRAASYMADIGRAYDPLTAIDRNADDSLLQEAAAWVDSGALAGQAALEATLRTTIGNTYRKIGRSEDARRQLNSALAIRRRVYPAQSVEVADSLHDLAAASTGGDFSEADFFGAEGLYREAIAIRRAVLGADHADTIETMHRFGSWLRDVGHPDAVPILREVVSNREKTGGQGLQLADSDLSLGQALLWTGLPGVSEEAEQHFRRALAIRLDYLGDRSPHVAWARERLAGVLLERERYQEAADLLRQVMALDTETSRVNPGHRVAFSYARCLWGLGKHDRAEELMDESVDAKASRKNQRKESWKGLTYDLTVFGKCLIDHQRYEKAEIRLMQAYSLARKNLNAGQTPSTNGRPDYASALARSGQDRLPDEQNVAEMQRKVDAQNRDDLWRRVVVLQIELYDAWEKPAEAEKWRKRLAAR